MDKKEYLKELEYLLSDLSEEDRQDALLFYENYFDEAGIENEQKVISELGEPSRIAMMIKDGLKGDFDENIHIGNHGFSNERYQRNYEIIKNPETKKKMKEKTESFKTKWNEMHSRDRLILILLAVLAFLPITSVLFGTFGSVIAFSFSIFMVFIGLIFGLWIVTFILHIIAIILIVVGVIQLFTLPGAGFILLGIGVLVSALAKIVSKLTSWFFKDCIPAIANSIADGFGKIFHPRGA